MDEYLDKSETDVLINLEKYLPAGTARTLIMGCLEVFTVNYVNSQSADLLKRLWTLKIIRAAVKAFAAISGGLTSLYKCTLTAVDEVEILYNLEITRGKIDPQTQPYEPIKKDALFFIRHMVHYNAQKISSQNSKIPETSIGGDCPRLSKLEQVAAQTFLKNAQDLSKTNPFIAKYTDLIAVIDNLSMFTGVCAKRWGTKLDWLEWCKNLINFFTFMQPLGYAVDITTLDEATQKNYEALKKAFDNCNCTAGYLPNGKSFVHSGITVEWPQFFFYSPIYLDIATEFKFEDLLKKLHAKKPLGDEVYRDVLAYYNATIKPSMVMSILTAVMTELEQRPRVGRDYADRSASIPKLLFATFTSYETDPATKAANLVEIEWLISILNNVRASPDLLASMIKSTKSVIVPVASRPDVSKEFLSKSFKPTESKDTDLLGKEFKTADLSLNPDDTIKRAFVMAAKNDIELSEAFLKGAVLDEYKKAKATRNLRALLNKWELEINKNLEEEF
jgi:hypothetical protein